VIVTAITELDIPLGLYAQQAANLATWSGDHTDDEWRKFCDAVEAKLTPRVQEKVGLLDAELEGERAVSQPNLTRRRYERRFLKKRRYSKT
jgi:hypothetical protein